MGWLHDSARYAYMAYHGISGRQLITDPEGWRARSDEYEKLSDEEKKRWESVARAVADNNRDLYD